MQGDLTALIERVEKATGPDRELDGEIFAAFETYSYGDVIPAVGGMVVYAGPAPHAPGQGRFEVAPKYTSSLDASLALVEEMLPGKYWYVCAGRARVGEPLYGAQIIDKDTEGVALDEPMGIAEHAHSAPLALLAALLRALISQKETADV